MDLLRKAGVEGGTKRRYIQRPLASRLENSLLPAAKVPERKLVCDRD
jgi:hypothetical protein